VSPLRLVNEVEQGRFTGAIGANQASNLALLNGAMHMVKREQTTEAFGNITDLRQLHSLPVGVQTEAGTAGEKRSSSSGLRLQLLVSVGTRTEMSFRINGTMAQQADRAPPGYGFGTGRTQHPRLLTGKATGKAGLVWIIVLLRFLGMRQQHQAVLVCRIAKGKPANFELDRWLIGKGGDRFGIHIGMLVRGVQLLEQAGNSLPKRG
jgi:hypothetical protein